jgi:predicted DsbA family dithiol-disulfide isomerase
VAEVTQTSKPPVVPRVLVFFDYACQFCYLDWPRFKRLRAEQDADLFLVPYELRPALPPEGIDVSELGGAHSEHVVEHMERMAREGGLGLTFPQLVPNTHLALALGEYARDTGPETHEAVHEAIFAAYNAAGRDIGDRAVLLQIAGEQGLDTDDVAEALLDGRYDERLHQFYHLALSMGISATPSALVCNELLIGSRPYKVLEESLGRCLVTAESLEGAPPAIER